MKKSALLLSFVFAAGVAMAQETASDAAKAKTPAKATATHAAKAAVKIHKVEAEVVSTDVAAKTITIKGENGAENKTAPVEGKAVAALKTVKAGEKYTLTCRDNEAGEHQAVVAIMKTPAAKVTAAKKSTKKY
jgi:ABC-type Fe3+-hydroxamate transport system substrate-binding protein